MAYAAVVTVERKGIEILVKITETEGAAGSEATIPLGVAKGRVLRAQTTKTAGSAATVDPILGRTATATGIDIIIENATAAAIADNQYSGGVTFYSSTGILYHRSVPASASDNTIVTEYHILVGWS